MKVYQVVMLCWDLSVIFSNTKIYGTFSTKEKAEEYLETLKDKVEPRNSLHIGEYEVDSPMDTKWTMVFKVPEID